MTPPVSAAARSSTPDRRLARPKLAGPAGARDDGWRPLLIVFAVALFVRCTVAFAVWDLPIVRTPKLDSFEYLSWARRLASGDFSWPVVSPHGPGYPYFLAAILALSSGSLPAVLLLQALLGATTATLVGAIGGQWYGARAGLAAGLVYAVYGPAIYIETALVAEGLLVFLLILAVWLLSREPVLIARAAMAGAAFGAAALVRPTALVIALACLLWLVARRDLARGVRLAPAAALAAALAIVTLPAVAKNWAQSGSASLQGYGGMNFYIGNSPTHTGRPTLRLGAGWDALNAEPSRAGIADPTAQDRYFIQKTVDEIRQRPAAFVRLLAVKCLWLVQAEEVRDSHSYYFFADQAPLLRLLPGMGVLFPLACVGAFVLARRRAPGWTLLVYYATAAAATVVLLVAGTRYRMPLVPALAIAAGAGIADAIDRVTTTKARRHEENESLFRVFVFSWLPSIAIAMAAIAVSHSRSDPRNRNLAEEWAFTGSSLITEHNLTEAETAYRRALALDPQSGLALDGLGLALYDGGRLEEARAALSRALTVDPTSARAAFHMALVDERAGRMPEAISGYRRALESSPGDAEIEYHLGVALGMAGRPDEARTAMRRVVELTPGNAEAWLDLCLLSIDLRDVDTASSALQRARELGAAPGRLEFASQALDRARAVR